MQVERLELTGVRSYPELDLTPQGGPQILYGPNAAGKTNLLAALGVWARGGSHRAPDGELVGWGTGLARLVARVGHGPDGASDEIEVAIQGPGAPPPHKRIRVDGVPRRATALGAALRVVLFAPEEMLLVSGSPALRRAALDTLAATTYPGYGRSLAAYGRALAQRNALLRRIREGTGGADELPPWDRPLLDEGGRLVAWRLELIAALAEPIAAAQAEIAPADGRLGLSYATNAPALPDETPTDALRRRLAETAEKEQWQGATLVGPHRDDLVFELDGRPLASFGSRGQQRSAILSLKLAELELARSRDGEPPLLLLDDVFSELDPERRAHLVRRILALPQAFVTTTALEDLDPGLVARSVPWSVSPGRVERRSS